MNPFVEALIQYWPTIVAGVAGLLGGLIVYLTKRVKYKQLLCEQEIANAELQKAIIEGSYIICPSCGTKIMLKSVEIKTGGIDNEK